MILNKIMEHSPVNTIARTITKQYGHLASFDVEALGDGSRILPAWLWMATHVYDNKGMVFLPSTVDKDRFIRRDVDEFNRNIREWLERDSFFIPDDEFRELALTPDHIRVYTLDDASRISEILRQQQQASAIALVGGNSSIIELFEEVADRYFHMPSLL